MEFIKKWGLLIIMGFNLIIFLNTCGMKTKIDRLDKKVNLLENSINFNDSIQIENESISREILMYEMSREIIYSENSVVRTTKRPDDLMNEYTQKIKELEEKKIKLNVRKQ